MRQRRRHRGFEQAARLSADQLGLSRARGTELVLAAAWRQVAGEAIARRTRAGRVRRGVLEVEVLDDHWLETLRPLIPRLAGRLAALRPDLGVKRFRLTRQEWAAGERAVPILVEDEGATGRGAERVEPPEQPPEEAAPRDPITLERLEAVRERYLRRSDRGRKA